MIDVAELRGIIQIALSDLIGTYRFSNGQEAVALRVDDGSDPYDEEPQITGLEVVIQPNLTGSITILMGAYQQTFTAFIHLKQWDIAETSLPAMSRLLPYLGGAEQFNVTGVQRVIRSTRLDNIETISIQISQSFYTANTF